MLDMIRYTKPSSTIPTYNAIRLTCRRKGVYMDMRYYRKVFASWLHKYGLSDVLIDLLQGRVGKSVLFNHYIQPGQSPLEKQDNESIATEIRLAKERTLKSIAVPCACCFGGAQILLCRNMHGRIYCICKEILPLAPQHFRSIPFPLSCMNRCIIYLQCNTCKTR
jgi:hypothetical protein